MHIQKQKKILKDIYAKNQKSTWSLLGVDKFLKKFQLSPLTPTQNTLSFYAHVPIPSCHLEKLQALPREPSPL